MTSVIPEVVYERLRNHAGPRCGYCRTFSKVTGQPLTVEHIIPLNNPDIVAARLLWTGVGWHPPED